MDQLVRPRRIPTDVEDQINHAIHTLPIIGKDVVDENDMCPICLTSLSSIFDEATEAAQIRPTTGDAVPGSSCPGGDEEGTLYGVTKIEVCGHIFCRRDLTEWIKGFHGSCPTCRQPFLDIHMPSESDDESSDGGEYIPAEDYGEEEEDTFDFTDAFSELDVPEADISLEDYLQHSLQGMPAEADIHSNASFETYDPSSDAGYWSDVNDIASDMFQPSDIMETASQGNITETEDEPMEYQWSLTMDSDDDMDADYVPMEEDYSSDSSEPSFSFTDYDSEGMSSEVDDSVDEKYHDREDHVSVHNTDNDILPGDDKGLTATPDSPRTLPSEGSK